MTIIPWYIIPGRRYPIQVYQFAVSYYCSNPKVSQRDAAEATRAKFKLEKFAHTTVGRSFRLFEQEQKAVLEKKFGQEVKISGAEGLEIISVAPKAAVEEEAKSGKDEKPHTERRFPSAADTADRREAMAGFLPGFKNDAEMADIETAVRNFVKDWNVKIWRLIFNPSFAPAPRAMIKSSKRPKKYAKEARQNEEKRRGRAAKWSST